MQLKDFILKTLAESNTPMTINAIDKAMSNNGWGTYFSAQFTTEQLERDGLVVRTSAVSGLGYGSINYYALPEGK